MGNLFAYGRLSRTHLNDKIRKNKRNKSGHYDREVLSNIVLHLNICVYVRTKYH